MQPPRQHIYVHTDVLQTSYIYVYVFVYVYVKNK